MSPVPTRVLAEVTQTLIDYRGKTPRKSRDGVKLITAKVIKRGRIQDGPHEYIEDKDYEGWMRRGLPAQGDILITTEAPLGEVAVLRTPEQVALAQRVILLRGDPTVIDQQYFFYALQSPFVQAELLARATGTTVLGIKQSELRQVRIPCLPMPLQRVIGETLSAYDNLVEINTRRIAILEEMARALYREWFINHRFPGHNCARFVKTPVGDIPVGWSATTLGDVAEERRQTVEPGSVPPTTPYVGLEHLPRRSVALTDWGTAADVQSSKLRFERGEILFGKIRPYFHKVVLAPTSGVCSTDAIVIAPKGRDLLSVVLGCVSSDEFIAHATQTSNGTKMPRANWPVLLAYPIPIPPKDLLRRYDQVVLPVLDEILNLILRTRVLRAARDLLLPKLISGELDVSRLADAAAEVGV